MLIYNFEKEFLGIDEKDLMALGYKNLSELKTEVLDFADLFVKTPGYIHNFKHVHWIDFITCAESYEDSKVIINVNNKNYRSTLTISTAFLVDNPSQKAYLVNLNNLRELTHQESEAIANDVIERPINNFKQEPKKIFNAGEEEFNEAQEIENKNITMDPYETPIELDTDNYTDSDEIKIDVDVDAYEEKLSVEDSFTDDYADENVNSVDSTEVIEDIAQEKFDNEYTYNPSVASEELGLPLDLIEEFIQDFIIQAREFKSKLYSAIDSADFTNIKILSHKLKGVAANLRVEDALETLTNVNTSSDINVIKDNLDTFYNIISKLAGEEIEVKKEVPLQPIKEAPQEIDNEPLLSFKDTEDDLYSDPDINNDEIKNAIQVSDDAFIETQESVTEKSVIEETIKNIQYSKESIANEIGLDLDSFNGLFEDYLHDSNLLVESIKSAINTQDYKTSQAEALRLKGMSDNMRIDSFSDNLKTVINSSDKETITQAIAKIEADLAQLSNLGV